MSHFALIVDGLVAEVIPAIVEIAGEQIGIADRYHPAFIAQLVPYDPENPPVPPPAPAAPVPTSVTMRQARLALLAAGKLAAVGTAIAGLPSPQKEAAQIEWDYAATVDRSSAVVRLLADALDLDAAALDALFTDASAL